MEEEFIIYGTAQVMVMNISYEDAQKLAERISAVEEVSMLAFDNSEEHYNNFSALFDITFAYEETDERCLEVLDGIKGVNLFLFPAHSKDLLHREKKIWHLLTYLL